MSRKTCSKALLLLAAGLSGCAGDGFVHTYVYGEAYIEEGIPADAFVDGWSVTFDRFLVRVGPVTAGGEALLGGARVVDLARSSSGQGHLLARTEIAADDYTEVGYQVTPDAAATGLNVDDDDLARIDAGPYAVYVEGEATRGGEVKRFTWGFAAAAAYSGCMVDLMVAPDYGGTVELTFHGDHLFYDDLFAEAPNVAFDLIAAADADGDGDITEAELRAVDIRGEERYQVGSEPISDLWSFIAYQTTTLGHIDGEGHCEAAPLD